MVPRRGFSWVIASRLRGSGRRGLEGGVLVREDKRDREGGFLGGEPEAGTNAGRTGSLSGGGVGGNMSRWTGGSDCCLDLLYRFGLTIWDAPQDMEFAGRSSTLLLIAAALALESALAVPANVLPCSDDAINLAFPK